MWPASWSIATPVAAVASCARGLVEQRDRALGEPGVPGGLGGVQQQSRAPLVVGGEPRRALERAPAAVAYALRSRLADARLLERRRGRVVGPDRGGGEVPGAPVDVSVGQRGGERPVGVAPLVERTRRRRSPTGRAGGGTRPSPARSVTSPAASAAASAARSIPSRCGRALEHRQIAAVAGRGEHQRAPGGVVELVDAAQERARDPRGDEHRGALGRERELLRRRRRARAAPAGCRRWRRAAARPPRRGSPRSSAAASSLRQPADPHASAGRRRRAATARPRARRSAPRSDRPPAGGRRTAAPARSSRRASGRRRPAPRPGSCSA